ncbi:MAG: hypothetical protein Satyrvirus1_9 [Satyrvirus sp.]|uniref:Uncharacterized protein n=1 Tax=Satyrvirus sp. TaxID=2487771 RepID=A0A3G5AGA4_9VIRU|nr:MAG: hypothetical protein Satyrvirus1_9 [Satyrvirus sp.]
MQEISPDILSKFGQYLHNTKVSIAWLDPDIPKKCYRRLEKINIFEGYKFGPGDKLPVSIQSYYDKFCTKDQIIAKTPVPLEGNTITEIYCNIDHPLKYKTRVRFEISPATEIVTYGMLQYLYTLAYQIVYEIEEIGIKNHRISDLVYDGSSKIEVYGRSTILCFFDCDSN